MTLLVAWANWIVMCSVKERPAYERLDPRVSTLVGEVNYKFVTPSYFICGQAPLRNKLQLLTYPDDVTQRDPAALSPRAELRILP